MAKLMAVLAAAALPSGSAGRVSVRRKRVRLYTECGAKGASTRADNETGISIVNGRPAAECEWRWQIGLRRSESSSTFCGGQLINNEWVLTAAHCVRNPNFQVVLGKHKMDTKGQFEQSRWAIQVIPHPQYAKSPTRWDFALVRLESPVEINACVGTVCLPTEGADVQPGAKCWITGWGTLQAGGSSPNTLQEAEVTTMSNTECVEKSNYARSEIQESMLCAQGRNSDGSITDACQGDSGGPLVCEDASGAWTLYGATSWGRGCAGEAFPGIWARIHEALGWIDETLELNQGPPPSRPPTVCPPFSKSPAPDKDGDCRCQSYPKAQYCSRDGGTSKNCPTANGAIGAYGGFYFTPSCEDCKCYDK